MKLFPFVFISICVLMLASLTENAFAKSAVLGKFLEGGDLVVTLHDALEDQISGDAFLLWDSLNGEETRKGFVSPLSRLSCFRFSSEDAGRCSMRLNGRELVESDKGFAIVAELDEAKEILSYFKGHDSVQEGRDIVLMLGDGTLLFEISHTRNRFYFFVDRSVVEK